MAALKEGTKAPDFVLPATDGKQFSLSGALAENPVVLAFFKVSCPICQYAFPYLERTYRALRGKAVTIIGVSQDSLRDTTLFAKEFGVTFPIALEDTRHFKVSNEYGLTNVPTIFEIDRDGTIQTSSVGWSRSDLESIYRKYAGNGTSPAPLFQPGENVSDFKAG